jgi:hypothetical protein
MTFRPGVSGNPHGRHRTRHLLNQEFMQANGLRISGIGGGPDSADAPAKRHE